jgi:hypothetical protein
MLKVLSKADLIDISPVDTKLVTITLADESNSLGANILNNIIINKTPLVIKNADLEHTSNPLIFTLNNDVATSYGLKSMTLDYSDSGLFSGPAISYDCTLGSTIIFSGPDDTQTLGKTTIDETETV